MKIEDINHVTVLGAGTMGPGLAQSYALHGLEVMLYSRRETTLEKALNIIKINLSTMTELGDLLPNQKEAALKRITATTSIEEAVQKAQYVVETVLEDIEVKRRLYAEVDKHCAPDAIIASNTSYLNVFELAPPNRLKNLIIAHWFAPPHLIPLVEVVKGPETAAEAVEITMELLRHIGKVPVLLQKFVPGFVINRLQRILGREIFYLLDNDIISPEQLDLAVKTSLAPRMMLLGVVQRYDFTGLDLSAKNLQNEAFIEAPLDNRPKSLFERVEKGHLGVKTGKGFYDYGDIKMEEILKERDMLLRDIFKSAKRYLKPVGGDK